MTFASRATDEVGHDESPGRWWIKVYVAASVSDSSAAVRHRPQQEAGLDFRPVEAHHKVGQPLVVNLVAVADPNRAELLLRAEVSRPGFPIHIPQCRVPP
jgi:hypothetical protein